MFVSYFIWFYRTVISVNLAGILFKEISIVYFISFLSFVLPFLLFYVRTKISVKFYFVRSDLNQNTEKLLLLSDIVVSIVLSLLVVLNIKHFYFSFVLTDGFKFITKISDFPFVLFSLKILLIYLFLVFVYAILPVLIFSHRGYSVRFLFFKIVPHKLSVFNSIYLFLLGSFLALFVVIYSVVRGIEIYPNYSLVISIGVLASLVTLIYSILLLVKLLSLREVKWFENLIFVVFVVVFFIVSFLPKDVQSLSIFRLEFIENFYRNLKNSKYALKVNNVDVSEVFDKVSVDTLRNLLNLKVSEKSIKKTYAKPIEVIRKLTVIERIPYFLSTGFVDKTFKMDLITTNFVDVSSLVKSYVIGSVVNSFSFSNTNYVEVSSYYRFLDVDLFYKRYIITYSSKDDLKVYNVFNEVGKIIPSYFLSTKDRFVINSTVGDENFKLFFVEDDGGYYVVSSFRKMILLKNENYFSFITKESYDGEYLLFLKNSLLFVSNITFSGKEVGVKLRYFYIEGMGENINEAISNLVGNADYYYKIIQLTNKIQNLKNYLDKNPDNLPPDVIDKLKRFILN